MKKKVKKTKTRKVSKIVKAAYLDAIIQKHSAEIKDLKVSIELMQMNEAVVSKTIGILLKIAAMK